MLFAEALSLHLDYLRFLNLRPRTVENYRACLQEFGKFCQDAGIDDIMAITPKLLERYRSHLFEPHDGRTLCIGSQVQKLCALNRFYQTLVEKGYLLVNIALKLPMPKMAQHMPPALPTVKEVERMLARVKTRTPMEFRDRAIMEVFYATGMRQAELASLKTTDVDLERAEVYVIGKGLKDRMLALNRRCQDCLRVYIKEVRPLLPDGPYLFPTKSGERLEAKTLLSILDIAAQKVKLKQDLTTHTFRHLLATELLRRGASMRAIQEYLGHSSVETTTRYVQVLGKDLKAVHAKTHPRERDLNNGTN